MTSHNDPWNKKEGGGSKDSWDEIIILKGAWLMRKEEGLLLFRAGEGYSLPHSG